jgi:hypothetical protein
MSEKELCDTVASLKTVEERQFYVNKPKYYGWYCSQIRADTIPYGCLDFAKATTWTHVVKGLPEAAYSDLDVAAEAAVERLKPEIRDGIHQYFYNFSIFFLSFF